MTFKNELGFCYEIFIKHLSNLNNSSLISFLEIVKGGTNLNTFGPAETKSSFSSKADFTISRDVILISSFKTRPCIRPKPLVEKNISEYLDEILFKPFFN